MNTLKELWVSPGTKGLIAFIIFAFILLFITCCEPVGTSNLVITGKEETLPDALMGLKVYKVATEYGYIYVAVNDKINSITYQNGDDTQTMIILDDNKVIYAKQIIWENDSIIIIRK